MKKATLLLSIIILTSVIGCNNQNSKSDGSNSNSFNSESSSSSNELPPVILPDAKLYDALISDDFTAFSMEEFNKTITFNHDSDAIYLGDECVASSSNQIVRIFVSDFDKDGYRELVYESGLSANHTINIRDLKNNELFFSGSEYEIAYSLGHKLAQYYHNLDVVDNKLVVKLTEATLLTAEVFDRGTIQYVDNGDRGEFSFVWENIHQIKGLTVSSCKTFLKNEVVEPVLENGNLVFNLKKETTYVFDLKLEKLENATDTTYPVSEDSVYIVNDKGNNDFDFFTFYDSETHHQDGIYQVGLSFNRMKPNSEYAQATFFYLEFFYTINVKFVD